MGVLLSRNSLNSRAPGSSEDLAGVLEGALGGSRDLRGPGGIRRDPWSPGFLKGSVAVVGDEVGCVGWTDRRDLGADSRTGQPGFHGSTLKSP